MKESAKIYLLFFVLLNLQTKAQEIKFPESFKADTSIVDPPPPPPIPANAPKAIDFDELDHRIKIKIGFAYLQDKKRQKFAPGNYRASTFYPAYETLLFTINKDSLLHGDYEYSFAERFDQAPTKQAKLTFQNGVKVTEKQFKDGVLWRSETQEVSVEKQDKDYLITINTSIKNTANGDKEVKTVFRNRKPISKITTRAGVSETRKDFERNYLDIFNNKMQLIKLQKPGLTEEYNDKGEVTYKKVWSDGYQFIYRNGVLRYKEVKVKNKDQFLVTEYDESGKISKEWSQGIENSFAIANPDEYEEDLSEALFEYYKKLAH